ncbi:MAG TPA: 5'-3' exonuclease H3TH domain-containing protein [Verrucomicrobiae bacterium]|nr:5'-3' exonuclease H3TH domain-containing protein [Verrucomicrobiae bacterium]
MQRLLIIDGHAYAYRAFHAIRELRSPSGQPTNAIYGFIKMLAKMRTKIEPTHLMVVWDGGLCAERMAALPEYKAQRAEMPDDLKPQLDEIISYLEASKIASYCGDGVEADDYIACLARHATASGMNVVIASADKDFMQLVSAQVGLLNPHDKTETVWTGEQVRAKTGLEPSQIVDWLSLRGDSVDNIPGVPGVGVKTATDLLQRFGTVENLYARLSEVKSERLRGSLRGAETDVMRNRQLVKLRDDLECKFAPDEMIVGKTADVTRLRELFQRWGFKGMLAALDELSPEHQTILI